MTDDLCFCIDGGGSKSRARLVDETGRSLAEAMSGPCNPGTNLDLALRSVADLWRQCSAASGLAENRPGEVAFSIGAAGIYVDGGERFLAACPRFRRVTVVSDGYAALIGAGLGDPCSLIIIGTGVAGHRLYANGLSIQRDAWGWIAGDRGGGSWIGQRALRHALAALDGVVAEDGLSRGVMAEIAGVEGLRAGWMRDLGAFRLASLAPVVLRLSDAGDPTAQRLRNRAVEHLAALIRVIAGPGTPIYAAGGLVPALRAELSQASGFPILEPKGDALKGCWLVATGAGPPEKALLFGQTVEDDR